ncbi:FAD-linked oxidoreductase [Lutibacter sp. Hel_I_33_5]|uniref:D-arabinono-1,4-lactone oxidase n=1 Tax=Lutibacter sp. Hel_I_33_5 TaxID=1566289 RepID=UPI0011A1E7FF|nr:D-arabinono-1,4-lactone oxidase [Lutibacter sp. Hel_I_33_5]TVZ55138.1 FAD-linked oxidoreductase [Lutibacter sp. Hel_I_33_5]
MKRRKFLKGTGIVLGATAIGGLAGLNVINSKISENLDSSLLLKESNKWSNWSGGQVCEPSSFFIPKNEQDLINKLKTTSNKFRVVGGGHSFSPVVPTNDILSSLKNLNKIISIDKNAKEVTVQSGIPLSDLTPQLHKNGLAFLNQGDIDKQTLGGAVSTSTHGTGKDLQSFAGFVKKFKLIIANGEILNCSSEENSEIFYGGTVALGSLGIVTEYTVQLTDTYKLEEKVYPADLNETLDNFWNLVEENRNFEIFPFFYSDQVVVKTLNKTSKNITKVEQPFLSDDFLLALGLTLSGDSGSRTDKVQNLISGLIDSTSKINDSYKIYPSVRNVKFNEMEYQIPKEKGIACVREILKTGQKLKVPIFFPLEIRVVKQDDFWMSPFYKRDVMSISVHQFADKEYNKYFPIFHEIFKRYEGRPHWGKLSYYDREGIKKLYPKYDDFVKLRNELDPKKRFSNDYINKIFG